MKYKILAILCLCFILWFTIQPVEQNWCGTDILLSEVTSGIAIVAVLILVWRKQQMSLSAIDIVVALWFAYVMFRGYVDSTYPCANFVLRVMQMVALYVCLRVLFSSVIVSERIIVLLLLICAIYEVILGANQMLNGGSRHYLYSMTGTFLNPGPYSIFLSMGLVMSCKIKKEYYADKGFLPSMMSLLPLVFLTLLPSTWSRAAILSAAICLSVIYWEQWKRYRWYVFGGLFLILIGLYFIKQGSADGRSIIYMISLLSICHNPVFGSGIGSFCHQYAEEMANFSSQHPTFNFQSADVIDGAFNSILQIGVEQGLVGVGFAVVLVVLIYVRLVKYGKILGMGLLCLLIFSMFSYPFDQLPYQIIFVLIAAYAGNSQKEMICSFSWYHYIKKSLVPLSLFCLIAIISVFSHQQIVERAKAEADYQRIAWMNSTAFIDDYYNHLPIMIGNEHFLFVFSKVLAKDGRYNDSNAILRLGTRISSDPMFYVIQGNNYSEMGFYKEAETAYEKAFAMMPNRLYPLYQLMLLYEKEGDVDRLRQMAQRVLAFKEKVSSSATKDMKKRARELCESLTYKEIEVAENL